MTPRAAALAFAAAALAAPALRAQACPNAGALTRGVTGPLAHVRYLADDALQGRMAGTADERCAGDYIAAQLRRLGLRPGGEGGTFFQAVPLASTINPHAPGGTGRNVVALLPGASPALSAEAIVIGAHYDHLGHGGAFSMSPGDSSVHNGADDNASGTAVLIDLARRLAAGPRPARTVVFVAFTGEEEGLLGSAAYTRNPAVPLERTRAMLNLDMVGRLGAGPLIVSGVETAEEWKTIVDGAAAAAGAEARGGGDGFGASDQTSFYVRDVPVLHFFTNVHADYHRPGDDWEKIDSAGLRRVAGVVERVARDVAGRPAALTFRRAAPKPAQAAAATPGYGAYLGTVPDFTPVPDGVKLSGVRAGSPAETAGIRAGDIIVRLGGMDVHDLQGMTDALRAHKPGDVVEITVLRADRRVFVTATLGTRGG